MLPIAHSTANAQIEITINAMGQLLACAKVEKGNEVTIIPVTEDSASRSSGVAPHSLCDKLCYIAKDYSFYTKENKEEYFEKYIEQLSGWVKSGSVHPMVEAIYRYLSKGTVIYDLLEAGILELDADDVEEVLNRESGVYGISMVSVDFRDIEAEALAGGKHAKLALDAYHYSIAGYIAKCAVAMGGIDVLTFTAGVGEKSPYSRSEICKQLGIFGVEISGKANLVKGEEAEISSPNSFLHSKHNSFRLASGYILRICIACIIFSGITIFLA